MRCLDLEREREREREVVRIGTTGLEGEGCLDRLRMRLDGIVFWAGMLFLGTRT